MTIKNFQRTTSGRIGEVGCWVTAEQGISTLLCYFVDIRSDKDVKCVWNKLVNLAKAEAVFSAMEMVATILPIPISYQLQALDSVGISLVIFMKALCEANAPKHLFYK